MNAVCAGAPCMRAKALQSPSLGLLQLAIQALPQRPPRQQPHNENIFRPAKPFKRPCQMPVHVSPAHTPLRALSLPKIPAPHKVQAPAPAWQQRPAAPQRPDLARCVLMRLAVAAEEAQTDRLQQRTEPGAILAGQPVLRRAILELPTPAASAQPPPAPLCRNDHWPKYSCARSSGSSSGTVVFSTDCQNCDWLK
jgi:hypothetical protein